MTRRANILVYVFVASIALLVLALPDSITYIEPSPIETYILHTEEADTQPVSLLFVGDIMLGRHVELLIEQEGIEYPFLHVTELLNSADITIANFEGSVPKVHVPTPSKNMTFSIQASYMETLRNVGIDILSLANNHSYDYGYTGYQNTLSVCAQYGLVCRGTAGELNDTSIYTFEVGEYAVGIIFIHTLFTQPSHESLTTYMSALTETSDYQFAYIHWGDEYEHIHNTDQETLALLLIDLGADAVFGHHPHVIQDVAVYKDVPIFYSLGNFVFDQYFSTDVMQGLAVRTIIDESEIYFEPIVVSSEEMRSQPRITTDELHTAIYDRIMPQNTLLFRR